MPINGAKHRALPGQSASPEVQTYCPAAREFPPGSAGYAERMRAMFVIYIVLIAAGLVTFTVIGLTHH